MDRLTSVALFLVPSLPVLLYPRYWLAIWITVGLFGLRMSSAVLDPDVDTVPLLRHGATMAGYNLALLLALVFGRKLVWRLTRATRKSNTSRGRWDWRRLTR